MSRPIRLRRVPLTGSPRRAPEGVRTSDFVLAVTFVALLGAFCLILLAGAQARIATANVDGSSGPICSGPGRSACART